MKKTLLICGHYPLPENIGGNIRTMNFVRFFKNYGTVDIAYSHILPEAKVGNHIFSNEYLLKNKDYQSFKKRLINGFIKGIPVPIYEFCEASQRLLRTAIEANDYDYIIVRYVYSTSILFKLAAKYKERIILDFDDILSGPLYESMHSSVNGCFKKFIMDMNKRLLVNYEKKCLNFSASLFCSRKDMSKVVGKNNMDNTFIMPNIYTNKSFEDYNFGDGFINGNNLLFVGTLCYKPNIDGLKWFIKTVFPGLKKEFPDAKLLVVGRFTDPEVKKLCEKNAGIELYADVPDIRGYYKQCKAVIVPLLAGGGTRIKILEAALANRPVLSTPISAEGLNLVNQKDLLLFENASGFYAQYNKLFNKDWYNFIVQNAKEVVLTQYSTQRFNDAMEKVLSWLEHKNAKRSHSILFVS